MHLFIADRAFSSRWMQASTSIMQVAKYTCATNTIFISDFAKGAFHLIEKLFMLQCGRGVIYDLAET
jgi:hypothetical protein